MSKFHETINLLLKFKKGDIIPNPDFLIKIRCGGIFYISRRSIAHIIQKEKVGLYLIRNMNSCIRQPDFVFLSNHSGKANAKRHIYFKEMDERSIAVVIEYRESKSYIVTAMAARKKYLNNKYKKLR